MGGFNPCDQHLPSIFGSLPMEFSASRARRPPSFGGAAPAPALIARLQQVQALRGRDRQKHPRSVAVDLDPSHQRPMLRCRGVQKHPLVPPYGVVRAASLHAHHRPARPHTQQRPASSAREAQGPLRVHSPTPVGPPRPSVWVLGRLRGPPPPSPRGASRGWPPAQATDRGSPRVCEALHVTAHGSSRLSLPPGAVRHRSDLRRFSRVHPIFR